MNINRLKGAWQLSKAVNSLDVIDRAEIYSIIALTETHRYVTLNRHVWLMCSLMSLIVCCQGS